MRKKQRCHTITYAERRGIKKGRAEGKLEERQQSIHDILEIKFREEGLKLFSRVEKIMDLDKLRLIRESLKKAQTIEEVEAMIDKQKN